MSLASITILFPLITSKLPPAGIGAFFNKVILSPSDIVKEAEESLKAVNKAMGDIK